MTSEQPVANYKIPITNCELSRSLLKIQQKFIKNSSKLLGGKVVNSNEFSIKFVIRKLFFFFREQN